MYLLYLDESGDANGWQEQQNFVLCGGGIITKNFAFCVAFSCGSFQSDRQKKWVFIDLTFASVV